MRLYTKTIPTQRATLQISVYKKKQITNKYLLKDAYCKYLSFHEQHWQSHHTCASI